MRPEDYQNLERTVVNIIARDVHQKELNLKEICKQYAADIDAVIMGYWWYCGGVARISKEGLEKTKQLRNRIMAEQCGGD